MAKTSRRIQKPKSTTQPYYLTSSINIKRTGNKIAPSHFYWPTARVPRESSWRREITPIPSLFYWLTPWGQRSRPRDSSSSCQGWWGQGERQWTGVRWQWRSPRAGGRQHKTGAAPVCMQILIHIAKVIIVFNHAYTIFIVCYFVYIIFVYSVMLFCLYYFVYSVFIQIH